jgi:prepilin-type N-terminal cleavage/methylation domain-containing protein/prepilin-type processing-associated H-X9-DG protein
MFKAGATRERAFTLIELLVVMAIIAVLAGLLLPALGRAKARSKDVACVNNLKQWALATLMYADDNDGRLPREGNATGAETIEGRAWYIDLPRYMNQIPYSAFRTNEYRSNIKTIWLCPANPSKGSASGLNLWHYAVNANVNGTGDGNTVARLGMMKVPVKTVWMMDTMKQNPVLEPVQSDRNRLFRDLHHRRGQNFAFLDGHAAFAPASEFLVELSGLVNTNNPNMIWRPLRPEFYQ